MRKDTKSGILRFLSCYKFEFIIMLFVFIYLYPVLNSGFVNDDVFNSLTHGDSVNNGVSVSQIVADSESYWFVHGRVFPLGPLVYYLFDLFALTGNMCFFYKLYIVLMTMVNVWLCGVLVEKITHSKRLKLLVMLIIPIFFQIVFISFSALYSFHGLMQSVMLFGLLSLIFTISYFEKQKTSYAALSAVFMAGAMLLYEVGFMFIFAVILIALFRKDRRFGSRIKAIIPQLVVFVLILLFNVYARMTAVESAYGGVEINLSDTTAVIKTFLKQFSAAVPLTQAYFGREHLSGTFIFFSWRQLVCLPIFAALSYIIVFRMKKDEEQEHNKTNLLTILIGCIFVIVPCFLISVSARYQSEIQPGLGYLPVYAEWLGMALISAGLFSLIAKGIKRKTPAFLLCIVLGLPILAVNICSMEGFFSSMYPHSIASRDVYVSAIKNGFYDEVNESNLLVYDNSPQFLALPRGDMFATYANRKIPAQDINTYKGSLSDDKEAVEAGEGGQEVFSPQETDAYFTKELCYDAGGGVILKGHVDSISPDTADPSKTKMLLSNVQLYLYFSEESRPATIEYTSYTADGKSEAHSKKVDAENRSHYGIVVDLSASGQIDADSVIIR